MNFEQSLEDYYKGMVAVEVDLPVKKDENSDILRAVVKVFDEHTSDWEILDYFKKYGLVFVNIRGYIEKDLKNEIVRKLRSFTPDLTSVR